MVRRENLKCISSLYKSEFVGMKDGLIQDEFSSNLFLLP